MRKNQLVSMVEAEGMGGMTVNVDLRDVRKVWGPDRGGLPCDKPLTRGAVTLQMGGGPSWNGLQWWFGWPP